VRQSNESPQRRARSGVMGHLHRIYLPPPGDCRPAGFLFLSAVAPGPNLRTLTVLVPTPIAFMLTIFGEIDVPNPHYHWLSLITFGGGRHQLAARHHRSRRSSRCSTTTGLELRQRERDGIEGKLTMETCRTSNQFIEASQPRHARGRGNLPNFSRCRHIHVRLQSAPETVEECAGRKRLSTT
jgi:hypothetical protein